LEKSILFYLEMECFIVFNLCIYKLHPLEMLNYSFVSKFQTLKTIWMHPFWIIWKSNFFKMVHMHMHILEMFLQIYKYFLQSWHPFGILNIWFIFGNYILVYSGCYASTNFGYVFVKFVFSRALTPIWNILLNTWFTLANFVHIWIMCVIHL
jgi:hypothetical protein